MSLVVPEAHQQFQVGMSLFFFAERFQHMTYLAHSASLEHQCRREKEGHVCFDGNKGCGSPLFKHSVQESRRGPQ